MNGLYVNNNEQCKLCKFWIGVSSKYLKCKKKMPTTFFVMIGVVAGMSLEFSDDVSTAMCMRPIKCALM